MINGRHPHPLGGVRWYWSKRVWILFLFHTFVMLDVYMAVLFRHMDDGPFFVLTCLFLLRIYLFLNCWLCFLYIEILTNNGIILHISLALHLVSSQ